MASSDTSTAAVVESTALVDDLPQAAPDSDPLPADPQVVVAAPPPHVQFSNLVRDQLIELETRLDFATAESLVHNAGSVRTRFEEIRHLIPEELLIALQPAAYMEYRFSDFTLARKNMDRRAKQRALQSAVDAELKRSEDEVSKVNIIKHRLEDRQSRLVQIRQEIEALKAALLTKEAEATAEENALNNDTAELAQQEHIAAVALEDAQRAVEAAPVSVSSDDDDAYVLSDIDRVRTNALAAIRHFLGH